MLFADVVATSATVAGTRARSRKIEAIADLLRQVDLDELPVTVALLTGEPRQGKIGVGWATVSRLEVRPAPLPNLPILAVDQALTTLAATSGPGSQAVRAATLEELFSRATEAEQWFLQRLLVGELRQGALAGIVTDAVAKASDVPLATIRRAAMLAGDLPKVAVLARRDGQPGLDAVRLAVLRPVQPMLAQTAEGVDDALALVGGQASVEWKLDGARIQVHRDGDEVRIYTRNLNEVTDRLAGVVSVVRALPVDRIVLDGEAVGWSEGEQPELFQATMSRFSRRKARRPESAPAPGADAGDGGSGDASDVGDAGHRSEGGGSGGDSGGTSVVGDAGQVSDASDDGAAVPAAGDGVDVDAALQAADPVAALVLEARFFDCLHLDGDDLLDQPLTARRAALERVAGRWLVPGEITDDPATAQEVLDQALAAGHEGVMVKAADSPYEAGRRGGAWRKVKPVRTLDLVVLAAEWGHGRRQGWLSNLHLGARDPEGEDFVMVGKTFKGLTDELLTWQTEEFQRRAVGGTDGHVVRLRPELVVEIALDGVQVSTRYAGGVALRFARVRRYRPDKSLADADTIDAVRALLPGAGRTAGS